MIRIFLLATIVFYSLISLPSIADQFPKSPEEKEMENMGSILQGKEISFSTSEDKPLISNKAAYKHLWDGSIEVLSSYPLVSIDKNSGVIITDWFEKQGFGKVKLMVMVKNTSNLEKNLKVIAHFKHKKDDSKKQLEEEIKNLIILKSQALSKGK